MYLGSDNYLGPTAYLGPGPNETPEPVGDETLIQWRDITLHGLIGRFTISDLAGWDDLPDSRQQWDARPNQHGTFDAPVLSGERHVMAAGWCFDRAQRDALLRELKRAMTFGPHAEELAITHAGQRLTVAARLVRFNATHPAWGAGYWGWQAEWVAPDPYRYGAKRMAYTGLPVKRGGLRYPLFTDGTVTGTSYAWTGTPGASTSTETVDGVVTRTNGILNPAPTAVGWNSIYAGLDFSTGHLVATVTTDSASSTTPRAQVVGATGATPVTAGEAYYLRCEVRHSRGLAMELRPWFMDEVGAFVALGSPAPVADTAEWMPASASSTVPAGASLMGYQVIASGSVVGDVFEARRFTTDPGPYFDGDTPDETIYGGNGILDYGEASDTGRVTLRNEGDADASPTFAVRGPAPQGFTITNVETGRRIVSKTVIPSGSTLTIHTAKGTAYLDGADRSGQLTVREWTPVPPGGSYTFQFGAPTYTGAALVASIRDTHW